MNYSYRFGDLLSELYTRSRVNEPAVGGGVRTFALLLSSVFYQEFNDEDSRAATLPTLAANDVSRTVL